MRPVTIRVNKRKLRGIKMLAVGLALLMVIVVIDGRVRPIITTISSYQAKLEATKSINDAVIEVISEEDVVYNSIISITQGKNGEVSSISTDMISMNRLKAEITNKVSDFLSDNSTRPVGIPIGTLMGGQILSGRGPEVEFRVIPAGYVHTEIYNQFQSAGINQTLHQIMLKVDATVSAVMPIYTVTTEVTTNICIAETIIVGQVPEAYSEINGDHSDPINMYNDYKADNFDLSGDTSRLRDS
ncbi:MULTISPECIES: sporulation protein YunB [Anaerotruncus]|jgi:sporulation protein YunB|uniref:sporulation protein YunB n=1 Tax=Anaerotruncus TaxID=244127 RepID=UPI0008366443|nr:MULTISPECIES: sporulation protein YunB [Anaerotruncus]RGX55810.1 sporulation protein YunB [Anaerotruncus sp. AF02-27]